jgi:hypothetical protein
MTEYIVGDGQVSYGAVVNTGDRQLVQSESFNAATGGRAYNTTVNSGGSQFLTYGSASGTVVNAGGNQYVYGTTTAMASPIRIIPMDRRRERSSMRVAYRKSGPMRATL